MKAIVHNGLDVEQISPRNGAKFSPNLYAWMTAKGQASRVWASRVYMDDTKTLWIGVLRNRELIGCRLVGVLCNGVHESTAAWQHIDAVEVADFWANYTSTGRCAIDHDHDMHFMGDETRWITTGDARACAWCNKATQTLRRWTETVHHEEWTVHIPAAI